MNQFTNKQISAWGIFKDRELESSYEAQSFQKVRKASLPWITSGYLLFLLFSIPEYLRGGIPLFQRDITVRILAVLFSVCLFFLLGRFKSHSSYIKTVTLAEFFFSIFYAALLYQSTQMNFTLKCMDIILFITIYFILPNKWFLSLITSLTMIAVFTAFCIVFHGRFTQDNSFYAGSVYIAVVFVLSAFHSYQTNFYKRLQFYDNMMLRELLDTDSLTGAFTRIKFNDEIKKQLRSAQQMRRKLSISIFDVDDFKKINDTYGHLEGDNILTGIADVVTLNKRQRDILTRWGGEEFVIVYPSTDLGSAIKISERIRSKIAESNFGIGIKVTCSFGITEYQTGDTPFTLLERADKFLYDAKALGKNAVVSGFR